MHTAGCMNTHMHADKEGQKRTYFNVSDAYTQQVHSYKRMLTHPLFFTLYLTPAQRQLLKIHQQDHITNNTLKVSNEITQ